MKFATLLIVAAACVLGCRPTHYTGATIECERPGETLVQGIDPKWEHITLKEWREDNRGRSVGKVAGEIKRK